MKPSRVLRIFCLLLAVLLLCEMIPVTSHAASVTYYQTSKENVPIWSASNSKSTKVRTIAVKGTVLQVTGSTKNSSGNLWYKLNDGNWVYSGNVTKHNHSYKGGICTGTKCGYEWPYSVSAASGTYVATNSSGTKLWSRPYSNNSKHMKTVASGTKLTVVGKTTNKDGNLWYKLSDNSWVWSGNVAKQLTVNYHANGGKGAPGAQTVLSGNSLKVSSTKPTRVGYIFQGWATASNASTVSHKSGTSYKFTASTTLYAVWKACKHTYLGGYCSACGHEYSLSVSNYSSAQTYIVTGASGAKIWNRPYSNKSTHLRTEKVNAVLKVTGSVINADGNTWYQLSDGNWVYSGNVTKQITVKFNAKGGKNAPGSLTGLAGKSMTLPSKKPTKVGYTFQGWSTSSDAKNVNYKAGASYSTKSTVTLYAVWKKCSHKSYKGGYCTTCNKEFSLDISEYSSKRTFVVTNEEGATIWTRPYSNKSTDVRVANYKEVLTITAKVKNADGNTWYQLSDGNWVYSGNVTQQYTVKYNLKGGKKGPSSQTFLSGKTLTLSSKKPKKEGYVFQGWSTSKDAKEVNYKAGASYSEKKNVTLYAVWKKCSHKSYKGGYCTTCGKEYKLEITTYSSKRSYMVTNESGSKIWNRPYSNESTKVRTAKYKTVLTITGKTVNADGNTWYQLSDGNWVYSGNVTRQYAITYNANGGKKAPSVQNFLHNEKVTLTSKAPTRSGYTFQGWATSKNAKAVDYVSGATYNENKDLTLYAVWSKCSHKFSHGICKNCKFEWPYETKNVTDSVYRVNNSNGASSYKRPYAKSSEKADTYKKNGLVLVTHKTVNENGVTWFKLKDGRWMSSENLSKQTTFGSIGAITEKYFNTLANGDITAKKISGKWYYLFTYKSTKVYVAVSAFTGESENSDQLDDVSATLTKAVNKHASASKTFVYNEKYIKDGFSSYQSNPTYDIHVWNLCKLTAEAGADTENGLFTTCTYNKGIYFEYRTKVDASQVPGSDDFAVYEKLVKPSNAKEYEAALVRRDLYHGDLYPQFTVSVTKSAAEYNSELKSYEFNGYFNNYKMTGKGYAKKKLDVEDYVSLFTSSVSVVDATLAFVKPDVAIAKAIYTFAGDAWSLSTSASKYTSSADYSSKKMSLTLYDEAKDEVYRVYKAKVKSPIRLQVKGDFIQTEYTLYKWTDGQTFDIDLTIK